MRSRLLALKRAPRVVGRPTPRGARVRVDVRVTAFACERASARARVLRACARTPLAGHRESCGFFLAEMKNRDFYYVGLVWNVDDQQREASDVHEKAISETV